MAEIDNTSLSVSIQSLQRTIQFYEFLEQSDTVNPEDYEEASAMFDLTLSRLCEVYRKEEAAGRISTPLKSILRPPYDVLADEPPFDNDKE